MLNLTTDRGNANNYNDTPSSCIRMAKTLLKNLILPSENMDRKQTHTLLVGIQTGTKF